MPFQLNDLQQNAGIVFPAGAQLLSADGKRPMALDSELVTSPNAGVLSMFTTYVDPRVINVLVEPMKAGRIFGETKKGEWTDDFLQFPIVEATGETSSYDDYSANGMAGANANWPVRDTYHYQTIVELGEREVARYGTAKLDWVAQKQIAAALTLNKFQNKSYFYGINGLRCYGLLNDPDLLPGITATDWANEAGDQVYEDIRRLYAQLISQTGGLVDRNDNMILLLSPEAETNLQKTNQYNVNVSDQIAKNFPNMRIETAPEMSTAAGEEVKLIVESYEGVQTVEPTFTEKMRTHAMVVRESSWRQKRSQGTVGTIIYRPLMIASLLVS